MGLFSQHSTDSWGFTAKEQGEGLVDRKSLTVDPQRRGTLNPPNRVLDEGRPRT